MNISHPKERNHSLDLLRGLGILGVLFHHTCLYNEGHFLPYLIEQASFLLEAPALFFVSGLTYQYINRNMIIGNLTKLSLVFTLTALLIGLCTKSLNWNMIVQPLFLNGFECPDTFGVLRGSYWFVPIYVYTLIFSTIIIHKFRPLYPLLMLFLLVALTADFLKGINMDWTIKRYSIHIIVFLFGYFMGEHCLQCPAKKAFIILLLLIVVLSQTLIYQHIKWDITDLHKHKDNFDLVYLSASIYSCITLFLLYNKHVQNALIGHIGKYSIFYFIGQGLSSSYLTYITPHIHFNYGFKLIILFVINFILMIIFSEVLRFIYEKIGFYYNKTITLLFRSNLPTL